MFLQEKRRKKWGFGREPDCPRKFTIKK